MLLIVGFRQYREVSLGVMVPVANLCIVCVHLDDYKTY